MVSAIGPVTPTLLATELSPAGIRADSLTIANLYGFAPAFFVASTSTVIYQAANAAPNAVSGITPIVRTLAVGERHASFVDRYA